MTHTHTHTHTHAHTSLSGSIGKMRLLQEEFEANNFVFVAITPWLGSSGATQQRSANDEEEEEEEEV